MQKSWYKVVRVRRKIKMSRFEKKNVLKSHCFFFFHGEKRKLFGHDSYDGEKTLNIRREKKDRLCYFFLQSCVLK